MQNPKKLTISNFENLKIEYLEMKIIKLLISTSQNENVSNERSEIGKSQIGKSQIGKYENGKYENGKSQIWICNIEALNPRFSKESFIYFANNSGSSQFPPNIG